MHAPEEELCTSITGFFHDYWLLPLLIIVSVCYSQEATNPGKPGPANLILPMPGVPLSAQQVEERVRNGRDGQTSKEIRTMPVYRDSAGRTRIEVDPSQPGESRVVVLCDPTTGVTVVLLDREKAAYPICRAEGGPGRIFLRSR